MELSDGMTAVLVIGGIILFTFIIILIVAMWKVYEKAGKEGWKSIIPIYSYFVLTEIAGIEWWWFLLAIADNIVSSLDIKSLESIANLISLFASFNIYYNIARKFNCNKKKAILAGIFPGIFVLIFGFSKKEVYNANIPVSKNGIFGTTEDNVVNNNDDDNKKTVYCQNCGTKINKDSKFCTNCGKENK